LIISFSAYNGSLISSLTSTTLSKPLETFKELLQNSAGLDIITIRNTAGQQFMSTTSNEVLRKIQEISDSVRNSFTVKASLWDLFGTVRN
jgi:hypothetical protein